MPICRYYEELQFLHDTVFNDETDSNVDIKFSQRASANVEMKVFEGEGNVNVPVTHEVTPPEKSGAIPRRLLTVIQNKLEKKFQQLI